MELDEKGIDWAINILKEDSELEWISWDHTDCESFRPLLRVLGHGTGREEARWISEKDFEPNMISAQELYMVAALVLTLAGLGHEDVLARLVAARLES